MRNRSVIGQLFFIQIVLFQKKNDRAELELFGKNTRAQRQVDNVSYGREKCSRSCVRREVGIGSRSQKVLDDWDTSLTISSSVTGLKKVS